MVPTTEEVVSAGQTKTGILVVPRLEFLGPCIAEAFGLQDTCLGSHHIAACYPCRGMAYLAAAVLH